MNEDTKVLLSLALLTLAASGFILGKSYEQAKERVALCHQVSHTLADYDSCTKLDNEKFMLLMREKVGNR